MRNYPRIHIGAYPAWRVKELSLDALVVATEDNLPLARELEVAQYVNFLPANSIPSQQFFSAWKGQPTAIKYLMSVNGRIDDVPVLMRLMTALQVKRFGFYVCSPDINDDGRCVYEAPDGIAMRIGEWLAEFGQGDEDVYVLSDRRGANGDDMECFCAYDHIRGRISYPGVEFGVFDYSETWDYHEGMKFYFDALHDDRAEVTYVRPIGTHNPQTLTIPAEVGIFGFNGKIAKIAGNAFVDRSGEICPWTEKVSYIHLCGSDVACDWCQVAQSFPNLIEIHEGQNNHCLWKRK